jgi:hypothetical protein
MAKRSRRAQQKRPAKKPAASRPAQGKPGQLAKRSAWAKLRASNVAALVDAIFAQRDPVTKALELLSCERPTVEARVWERLLDYVYGRPPQRVVASGPRGGPVRVEIISHIPRPRREARAS